MAEWTNIPDDVLEPGKPIRSVDAIALRDNPVAIAEGAAGAPRVLPSTAIDWAASINTAAERDWVLSRTAGASVGAVGTYAWLGETATNTSTAPGGTRAGSALRYAGVIGTSSWGGAETSLAINRASQAYTNTPPGTWRCMGHSLSEPGRHAATLWLRIS